MIEIYKNLNILTNFYAVLNSPRIFNTKVGNLIKTALTGNVSNAKRNKNS